MISTAKLVLAAMVGTALANFITDLAIIFIGRIQ